MVIDGIRLANHATMIDEQLRRTWLMSANVICSSMSVKSVRGYRTQFIRGQKTLLDLKRPVSQHTKEHSITFIPHDSSPQAHGQSKPKNDMKTQNRK
jgi:hypothetical protein